MDQIADYIKHVSDSQALRVLFIIGGSVVVALLCMLVIRLVRLVSTRTKNQVDDEVLKAVRWPLFVSVIIAGLALSFKEFHLGKTYEFVAFGVFKTAAVLVWGMAAMRIGTAVLEALSRQVDRITWIQPKTLPLFEITMKVLVVGAVLYFAFVAWNINVTSWLASAGIVGIAVGFAAKDTLANLFSGIFILADAPYKLGDFIILDNGLRGIVTDIGIRSTRLLTRDDIEITIPNAVIANAKIVNETSGPYEKMRVKVRVEAAYGSDVDQVREVLLSCASEVEHLADEPAPRVRFREFGASGLAFELMAWIDQPIFRGRVLDALNTRVYKAFNAAGIEIPYSKHDVYIKEQPGEQDPKGA